MEELQAARCRVVFVSYSDPAKQLHRLWIQEWIKDNKIDGASTMLLLDPTKSTYESFHIPSSNIAAWGPANVWYYIKAICLRGRRTIAIRGEAGQLGADFVLDRHGNVLLKHYCRNPTDRVEVSKILQTITAHAKDK